MIKLTNHALLTVALLGATIGLANCSSTPTTNTGNTAVVVNSKPADKPADIAKNEAPTGDKVGVPECDEYIAKYEACINSKVPEAQRAMFKTSFETMRKSWKESAANPQSKAALASGCKQALDTAKQSMSAFSCDW